MLFRLRKMDCRRILLSIEKILSIQEALLQDVQYQQVTAEHTVLNARFLETVNALEKQQQDAIFDYLGLILQMHLKMLEYTCQ